MASSSSSVEHVSRFRFFIAAAVFFSVHSVSASSSSPPVCSPPSNPFLLDLLLRCPPSISPSLPVQQKLPNRPQSVFGLWNVAGLEIFKVDGESLDRMLGSSSRNGYTAVLFYASWCPFSRGVRSKFDALSSMFPQIIHLAVEQSSAMPSAYSRYGVHSVPSILLVNPKETTVRYCGPKNLQSLLCFYKETTGSEPIGHLTENESYLSDSGKDVVQLWNLSSLKEIAVMEPYLAFAVLFLLLRGALPFFPQIISRLVALWASYIPHLNLGIFGDASQLVGRIIDLVDLKRAWSKLKLCKTRNFHEQAISAQVWASSLASVSLGKTRTSSMGGYSNE